MSFRRHKGGTIGFYDEMPALFMVSIALLIFFASTLNAFESYRGRREDVSHLLDVQEFLVGVRTSGSLTHMGQPGLFEAGKVLRLNRENVTGELNLPQGSFFRIMIFDLGNYTLKFDSNVTNARSAVDLASVTQYRGVLSSPVSIWVNDEEVHPAQLRVELWR